MSKSNLKILYQSFLDIIDEIVASTNNQSDLDSINLYLTKSLHLQFVKKLVSYPSLISLLSPVNTSMSPKASNMKKIINSIQKQLNQDSSIAEECFKQAALSVLLEFVGKLKKNLPSFKDQDVIKTINHQFKIA